MSDCCVNCEAYCRVVDIYSSAPKWRQIMFKIYTLPLSCNDTMTLPSYSRVLPQTLANSQLIKNSPVFYGKPSSLPHSQVSANCPHPECDQSSPRPIPHPTSWRSFLILSSHLCLGLLSWLLPSGLPTKNSVSTSPVPCTCHMLRPSHSYWFDHPNYIWWAVLIVRLLIMQIQWKIFNLIV